MFIERKLQKLKYLLGVRLGIVRPQVDLASFAAADDRHRFRTTATSWRIRSVQNDHRDLNSGRLLPGFLAASDGHLPPSVRHSVKYRPDIDGLRAVAILSVVLFHAGIRTFAGGFVGVDIFFVISGYLVGGHVLQEVTLSRFSYAAFYTRRAKRIAPAFIAMVSLVTVAAIIIMSPAELLGYSKSSLTAVLGISNIWFWHSTSYFSPDAKLDPMLMTWSLGIEEQFYILLPLGIIALKRLYGRGSLTFLNTTTAVSFLAFVIVIQSYPGAAFYLLPLRFWELGTGTLIAAFREHRTGRQERMVEPLGWVGAAAMICAILLFNEASKPAGIGVILAVLGAGASIIARGSWINRRVLASEPVASIGLVSYSWYLWHWPLMAFIRLCSVGKPSTLAMSAAALLSLIIAWASWRFVEQPFRRPAESSHSKVLTRYAGMIGLLAIVPLFLYGGGGLPSRIGPDAATITKELTEAQATPCMVEAGDIPLNLDADCVSGGASRIAVIGDSHAVMLAGTLRAIALHHGYGTETFAKSTCPVLVGLTHDFPRWPGHARQCADHNRSVLSRVLRDPTVKVIFLEASWGAPLLTDDPDDHYRLVGEDGSIGRIANLDDFERAVQATVSAMRQTGKKIVLLDDVPMWRFDPADQLYVSRLPAREALQQALSPKFNDQNGIVDSGSWVVDASSISRQLARSASAVPGTIYLPLKEAFCNARECRYRMAGTPYFSDNQHVTRSGAETALHHFDAEIALNSSLWH